jgi:hypothetical protein
MSSGVKRANGNYASDGTKRSIDSYNENIDCNRKFSI